MYQEEVKIKIQKEAGKGPFKKKKKKEVSQMRLNRLMVERHDGYWQTLPLIYKFWPTWAKYSCESELLSVVKN